MLRLLLFNQVDLRLQLQARLVFYVDIWMTLLVLKATDLLGTQGLFQLLEALLNFGQLVRSITQLPLLVL